MRKRIVITAVLLSVITGVYFLGTLHTGNREVPDICIDVSSEEFYNNYVDMEQVTGFDINKAVYTCILKMVKVITWSWIILDLIIINRRRG